MWIATINAGVFRLKMFSWCCRPAVVLPAARSRPGDLLHGETASAAQQPPSPVQQQQMQRLAKLAADVARPRTSAEPSETLDDSKAHGAPRF